MEMQLKQRLIGVVVIFTLLIIFLPMVFENNNEQKYVQRALEPPVRNATRSGDLVESHIQRTKLSHPPDSKDSKLTSAPQRKLSNDEDGINQSHDKVRFTKAADKPEVKYEREDRLTKEFDLPKNDVSEDSIRSRYQYKSLQVDKKTKQAPKKQKTEPVNIQVKEKPKQKESNQNSIQASTSTSKNKVANAKITKAFKVNANKSSSQQQSQAYTLKLAAYKNKDQAVNLKLELVNKGFPSYINFNKGSYSVYVGPELEKVYIRELARRLSEETKYSSEIVSHNVKWKVE